MDNKTMPGNVPLSDLLAGPWVCRKMAAHYAIEAPAAGNVRVAEVRHVGRPDGSASEREARAIATLPELAAAAEAVLRDVGFGRIVFDTGASTRLWAALSAVHGRQIVPQPSGCYPEEWGPSTDRRLTCACGNSDPAHWQKAG